MATTTAKAFAEFLDRLEPTEAQKAACKGRVRSVADYLSATFTADSDMPLKSTALIGSAGKGTGIRPVEDVDVLAVFGNSSALYWRYWWNSRRFLYRVRDALAGHPVEVVGARGQAVRLFYKDGPYADIAPVLEKPGGGYRLPAGDRSWIDTNPLHHQKWLNERNAALGSHVKPVVKLVKAWNRTHSQHFRSFHLEVAVASAFDSLTGNYREAVAAWLDRPHIGVCDPWTGNSLAGYMPWYSDRRADVKRVLSSSAKRARDALDAEARGDHEEAIRLWRIILGEDFPAFG